MQFRGDAPAEIDFELNQIKRDGFIGMKNGLRIIMRLIDMVHEARQQRNLAIRKSTENEKQAMTEIQFYDSEVLKKFKGEV